MYVVIAESNARDTSTPSISPRVITEDPKRALLEARKAFRDNRPFLSGVAVFRLETEFSYSMDASSGTHENPCLLLVFNSWSNHPYKIPEDVKENFYHDFAGLCGEKQE